MVKKYEKGRLYEFGSVLYGKVEKGMKDSIMGKN